MIHFEDSNGDKIPFEDGANGSTAAEGFINETDPDAVEQFDQNSDSPLEEINKSTKSVEEDLDITNERTFELGKNEVLDTTNASEKAVEPAEFITTNPTFPRPSLAPSSGQQENLGRRWYVIHTYSGYENKVKRALERRIESMDMRDRIFGIVVPYIIEE